jgi:hypothetical protein
MQFLHKILPLLEQELDTNITSTAFDGYYALRDEAVEDIQLWRMLSVDLEKHKVSSCITLFCQAMTNCVMKVVYPDWSKGNHFPGIITRCHVTRNKERIYDVEPTDGRAKLSGVREEYIRALSATAGNKQRRSEGRHGR